MQEFALIICNLFSLYMIVVGVYGISEAPKRGESAGGYIIIAIIGAFLIVALAFAR